VSYAGDSPPTGFPSAARNNNGDVTFTFDSSYDDDYGVAGAYSVLAANATVNASSAVHRVATATILTSTTVQVRVYDAAGAAVSDPRVTLVVT
jgi:hypothetical protein